MADWGGEEAHQQAIAEQKEIEREQDIQDEVSQQQNREKVK